jgi:hypothetical protein
MPCALPDPMDRAALQRLPGWMFRINLEFFCPSASAPATRIRQRGAGHIAGALQGDAASCAGSGQIATNVVAPAGPWLTDAHRSQVACPKRPSTALLSSSRVAR